MDYRHKDNPVPFSKVENTDSVRVGPIVGFLVYTPVGHRQDFLLFLDHKDATAQQKAFDIEDPDHEHLIERLVCLPSN